MDIFRNKQRLLLMLALNFIKPIDLRKSFNITELTLQDVPSWISENRYPLEVHYTVTEDGYVLALHRIMNGSCGRGGARRPPVLLMHGLVCTSMDFLLLGPDKGLGFILADNGYDVWLGNNRGNYYSRKHIRIEPEEESFWEYSYHEMGIYDLPAMIDYILQNTDHEKLLHVGHSQGTTSFYVMASMKPEYNDKVILHVGLAPIVFVNNHNIFLQFIARYQEVFYIALKNLGFTEILPRTDVKRKYALSFCSDNSVTQPACSLIFGLLYTISQQIKSLLPFICANYPAGSSLKSFIHYLQGVDSGRFRQFDNRIFQKGRLSSLWEEPPDYRLDLITTPIVTFFGSTDTLNPEENVQALQWNHADFMYGKDAPNLVYNNILKVFDTALKT